MNFVLHVWDASNFLLLTVVSGKVKETVPWPFSNGEVEWAQRRLLGA